MILRCLVILLIGVFTGQSVLANEGDQKKKTRDALLASRSYNYTLDLLSNRLVVDIQKRISNPLTALVTKFTMSSNLPEEFENYSFLKISKAITASNTNLKMIRCIECTTLNLEMQNGETLLKKGIVDQKELDRVLAQYNASNYAEINLSLIGSNLTLILVIYERKDNSIIYTSETTSPVYSIRDDGIIFGVSVATLLVQKSGAGSMIGGKFYVGQRISRFGDVGMSFASYTSTNLKGFTSLGLMADLNINDMFEKYWRSGSFYISNTLGFATYRTNAQLFYSLGVKFKFGLIFSAFAEYSVYKVLKLKKVLIDETKDEVFVDPNKDFPKTITIGLGLDLG
jgi:hypothetical protein